MRPSSWLLFLDWKGGLQYKLDDEGWIGDRRRHIFTVPADASAPPEQLTHGDYED